MTDSATPAPARAGPSTHETHPAPAGRAKHEARSTPEARPAHEVPFGYEGRSAQAARAPSRPFLGLNVDRRYRFVYKPAVFAASLMPFGWLICCLFGWLGFSAGVDPVKFLELECGQTALNFIFITLMVTPVRQLSGLTHLLRLRRMLGLFAFFYVTLHFTVYVVLDLEFDWRTLGADIAKRPYITVGFTAFLMLIPLAVTSTNRMMRRLGRRWTKLHRLVYVIAAFGVWHFYWQEEKDVREPILYAAVLALLLGYRAVRTWRQKHPAQRRMEQTGA